MIYDLWEYTMGKMGGEMLVMVYGDVSWKMIWKCAYNRHYSIDINGNTSLGI